jgi:hypothetical protein
MVTDAAGFRSSNFRPTQLSPRDLTLEPTHGPPGSGSTNGASLASATPPPTWPSPTAWGFFACPANAEETIRARAHYRSSLAETAGVVDILAHLGAREATASPG